MSGIAAATKLYESGFQNITILEAQNWIGGRINTGFFNSHPLEMGAAVCHGGDGNVVYNMVNSLDILEPKNGRQIEYRQLTGDILNSTLTDSLDELAMELLAASEENNNSSTGAFILERLVNILFG